MKTTLIAAACALALSTAGAMAQSSQGDSGPGTRNNKEMGAPSGTMNKSGMSGQTTGSGMSGTTTGSGTMNRDGMARNPSSQGNAGPGTDPARPAGR